MDAAGTPVRPEKTLLLRNDGSIPTVPLKSPSTRPWGEGFPVGHVFLGRYTVVGTLGRGGMGVVLRCRDRVSDIDVAVKALPPELSQDETEMSEIRENFRLVYRLRHHNIAAINVLEQDSDTGDYFLVMENVEGANLQEHIRRRGGKLSSAEAADIVRQVAEGLDYAHSQRIIHRDVKPANIVICPDGTAKILDFGIAAQINTSLTRVSRSGFTARGTGPYMAPEQWQGRLQNAATDQYALAVTAYEMLAGRPPFTSNDMKVLMTTVLHRDPVRPGGIPAKTWRALVKALSKDGARRFASCTEFAWAMAVSTPATQVFRLRRPRTVRLHMPPVVVGSGAVAAIAVAFGVLLMHRAGTPDRGAPLQAAAPAPARTGSPAEAPVDEAERLLARASALLEEGKPSDASAVCDSAQTFALSAQRRIRLAALRRAILFTELARDGGDDWVTNAASAGQAVDALIAEGDAYFKAGELDAGVIKYREAGKLCEACPGLEQTLERIGKTISDLTNPAGLHYHWPAPR